MEIKNAHDEKANLNVNITFVVSRNWGSRNKMIVNLTTEYEILVNSQCRRFSLNMAAVFLHQYGRRGVT